MSIELVLALIFFVVLPLVERFFRAARERQQQGEPPLEPPIEFEPPPPAPPAPVPAPRAEPRPRPGPRPGSAPASKPRPTVLPARPGAADAHAARERAHRRETAGAFEHAMHRARRQHREASVLRDPAGFRRAVVWMTILGPCRALSPYEWDRR